MPLHTSEHLNRWLICLALIAVVLVQAQPAAAWGNEGHIYINRVAAQKIPAAMPRFLRRAAVEIAYLGPEPDRWRNPAEFALKNAQEPDHFIDLERVSWLDPLPAGRYEFYRKLYEKRAATPDHADDYLPERVGLQPYITMESLRAPESGFPRIPPSPGRAPANAGRTAGHHFLRRMAGPLRRRRLSAASHNDSIQRLGRAESQRIHDRAWHPLTI